MCARTCVCVFFTRHTHVLKAREKEGNVECWDVKARQRGRGIVPASCLLQRSPHERFIAYESYTGWRIIEFNRHVWRVQAAAREEQINLTTFS